MRLTQISLQGFKSFGNRTTVEFAPGVTAIVGPNGSGKSNLLDALKWVTGGGRAKAFRAEAKTDLIFHGADGKRGLSYAEVEVELSDGRRSIKVRRDMDREGHSRLRLDGRAARFIDVDEVLAGSGLGTAGVAIIGQGEVAGVLLADPATLLAYVAEAAGVARLAGRREQTLNRLESARGHLARLHDVVIELRERVLQLEGEAQAALQHGELAREALVLRITAAHARARGLEDEVASLRTKVALGEQDLLVGRETQRALREARELASVAREEQETAYRLRSAEVERAQGLLRLARSEAARVGERKAGVEQRLNSARGEMATLSTLRPPEAPAEDAAALKEAATRAALDAAHVAEARSGAQISLRAAEAELLSVRERHDRLLQAWAEHRARSEAAATELARAEAEVEALRAQGGATEAGSANTAELARTRLQAALGARAEAQARLEACRSEMEAAHARHAEAYAEQQARQRAASQARTAFEARRGYAQGPRVALTSGVPGVIGSVADLLRVAPGREAAVAAALGRRAEYVVVEDAACAEAVLVAVRKAGAWVTLLPLDLLRSSASARRSPTAQQDLGAEGVLGPLSAAVEVDEAYRVVVDGLLANTVLVQDLTHATRLAKRHGHRPRLVTLDGDLIEASGAISGGRRTSTAPVLGAAKEVEEAETAATEAGESLAAAIRVLEGSQAAFGQAKATADAAHEAVMQAQEGAAAAEHALNMKRERVAEAEARLTRLREALQAIVEPEEAPDPEGLEQARVVERQAREALERVQAEVEAAVARRSESEQRAAVAQERALAFQVAQERFDQAVRRIEALREETSLAQEEAKAIEAEEKAAITAVKAAEDDLPQDLDAQREAFESAQQRLREAETAVQESQAALTALSEEIEGSRLTLARREAALDLAMEEKGNLPEGVEPLAIGERSARTRLREVELAMEALGAINHRAADEHREQAERLATLETEVAQAEAAVVELSGTLDDIDEETNERLGSSLGSLRTAFAEHVRRLFGEGAIGLIEVENDGRRPVGLRIQLQPPGKRTRSLGLLSVGERTMGAMAFLFALMAGEVGRLPIAVLDEVDAPLDEANIRRFCGFVTSLAEHGTQFVLITHQKSTFEVADTLWGVTTEQGVSRVFSIRRDAAVGTSLDG